LKDYIEETKNNAFLRTSFFHCRNVKRFILNAKWCGPTATEF